MPRDHWPCPFFLFLSLFSIPKSNPVLLFSHRRGSLAADCWCCTAPQRHGSVSSCVFECDSLIHPFKHYNFLSSSVSSLAALGGGWRVNRACVGSSPISLISTQREETPALRFRSQALSLVLCISWPFASPPLPPSPLPSSLSISPPPPAAAKKSQSEQMREKELAGEEGRGLRLAAKGTM